MGMAGGGEGALIGQIHRAAARLDGEIELVCGAFSSTAEVSSRTGATLGLPAERVYGSWQDMLAKEAALPADARMQFVAIVTPNDLHLPIAKAALEAGFHVLSDKPAALSLEEARVLREAVKQERRCYALTHTYLGYPMLSEARARIRAGEIGRVRRVAVEYSQGWLATAAETAGNAQALWRTDPQRAGAGGAVGDIGVHAFGVAEYVSALHVTRLCADLGAAVEGRRLDDHGSAFLRFANGAHGVMSVSQISAGEDNQLTINVYGGNGGIRWSHRDHDSLHLLSLDGGVKTLRAGSNVMELHPEVRSMCRTPAGHPQGFIEAFANLYRLFAADLRDPGAATGQMRFSPAPIEAAVREMAFIEAMVRSSAAGQQWLALE
jgi:predicted dehydrogenase